jgi:hypothetical protein
LARAIEDGSAEGLRSALHPDAVAIVDAGTHRHDSGYLHGRESVLQYLLSAFGAADVQACERHVNGGIGIVVRGSLGVIAVIGMREQFGQLARLWVVSAPEKLTQWNTDPTRPSA